jgi:type II secretory pathway pseudopilin PulG
MLVIGIIAILAGLLYPVILGAVAKAKQKQAMAETRTMLMAIKAYRQEYGKWPAQIQATQDTTYVINNWLVIQPLFGSNVTHPLDSSRQLNPKNKIFLSLQVSSNNPDYAGNYLDPWGIPYLICMDENEDNQLSIPAYVLWSYVASNTSGRQIGETNILFTNAINAKIDAGVASMGGSSNTLPWYSWSE